MKRYLPIAFSGIFSLLLFLPANAGITTAEVKDVARELACLCGSCPRRPLDQCTCGWATEHRDRIAKALEAGQTKEAIVAGFIEDFGLQVLSAPPKKGFNLAAWAMPFLVLATGGLVVRSVIARWSQSRAIGRAPEPQTEVHTAEDRAYLQKLEQQLKERDL